jgi:hypothetical protein
MRSALWSILIKGFRGSLASQIAVTVLLQSYLNYFLASKTLKNLKYIMAHQNSKKILPTLLIPSLTLVLTDFVLDPSRLSFPRLWLRQKLVLPV